MSHEGLTGPALAASDPDTTRTALTSDELVAFARAGRFAAAAASMAARIARAKAISTIPYPMRPGIRLPEGQG